MRPLIATCALVAAVFATPPSRAHAKPILPGPGDSAHDPTLSKLAAAYARQHETFNTAELGISLNAFVKPAEMQTVRDWMAQDKDFQTFSGKHVFDVVERFNEHEDLGNFGGVASVGYASRFLVLQAQKAPAAELARARDQVVRAARTWIVFATIGGPGVVARGVRRVKPANPTDPPIPGMVPALVPMKDASGNAQPADKDPTWRAPVAPGFDDWIWIDDSSKDQVIGYAAAVAWLWDALKSDPDAPAGLADQLAAPLVAFAKKLMEVAPETGIDMCIRDADGRLSSFFDLHDRLLGNGGTPLPEESTLRNGFNAALGLAVIRAAHHVSGDDAIGRFYYEELIAKRNWHGSIARNSGAIFLGSATNYSNVNMLALALVTLGRFERDTRVRETLMDALEGQWWSTGNDRDVSHVGQAWFDAIYAAWARKAPADIRARVTTSLGNFNPPPAFQRDRINCDDTEIAAGVCLAIDGKTTITLSKIPGHGGGPVAKEIVPMVLRRDSDMEWRGDPHSPNAGGGNRLNPGGDFLGAYWLARLADVDEPHRNVSPFARAPLPWEAPGTDDDAGIVDDAGSTNAADGEDSGCGCTTVGRRTDVIGPLAVLAALFAARAPAKRKRRRRHLR